MDDLGYVKHVVIVELSNLGKDIVNDFLEWVKSGKIETDLHNYKTVKKPEKNLSRIAKDLKKMLPFQAILSSENIIKSESGPNSDCDSKHTLHIDEFIYNDSDVELMQSKSVLQKYYCTNCDSSAIKEKVLLSHSLDNTKLSYIFNVLLPADLQNYKLLDVGSRIGAVLFGAYYWSNCPNIIGVEINGDLCDIQNKIVSKYCLNDRVKIVNSDILCQSLEVSSCDIIILHNVFEFFMPVESQKAAWNFIKCHLKKGCTVISVPSIEESLDALGVYDDFSDWLKIVQPSQNSNTINFDMSDTQFGEIHLYRVK